MTTQNHFFEFTLTTSERAHLADAMVQFNFDHDTRIEDSIARSRLIFDNALPRKLRNQFAALRDGIGPAVIIVHNLPTDDGVAHGISDPMVAVAEKRSRRSEAAVLGAAAFMGEPYGISTQGRGVVNNLLPSFTDRKALTGLGSSSELSLHVENMALRRHSLGIAPDGLALVGVSADPAGSPETLVVDARAALQTVSAEAKRALREDFALKFPYRWRGVMDIEHVEGPIVRSVCGADDFTFALYGDMVKPLSDRGARAFAQFRCALERLAVGVKIEPGTLVLINNRIAAHGRTAFRASFTPEGLPLRWVQRTFWTQNLAQFDMLEEESVRVFRPVRRSLDSD